MMELETTFRQREILDALAFLIQGMTESRIYGSQLRETLPNSNQFSEHIEHLIPHWIERVGHSPNEAYHITLRGLLASARSAETRTLVEQLLDFLGKRYRADPNFQEFTWTELKDMLAVTDEYFAFVNAVMVGARLFKPASSSFTPDPHRGAGRVAEYRWACPQDIENLILLETTDALLSHRRAGNAEPASFIPETRDSVDLHMYDVCLSYAGEDRIYVEEVAALLHASGVRVYYDQYNEADSWGKDLYAYLDEIYRTLARFCVMFVSRHYPVKLWTKHERESAQARAFKESEVYILPARFDDTKIPGLPDSVGFIDLQEKSPRELAALIQEKLKGGKARTQEHIPHSFKQAGQPVPLGRDNELQELCRLLNEGHTRIVVVTGVGGVGKTSLVAHWMTTVHFDTIYVWEFRPQLGGEASSTAFFEHALRFFQSTYDTPPKSPEVLGERLGALVAKRRCLLVLDGLDVLQHPPESHTKRAASKIHRYADCSRFSFEPTAKPSASSQLGRESLNWIVTRLPRSNT